jgi:predicted Fe-Mo cluster-binding NifX family protein
MTATRPSDDLPAAIGKPALRALNSAGIRTLAEVALRSEAELMSLHGVGPKALRILKSALTKLSKNPEDGQD